MYQARMKLVGQSQIYEAKVNPSTHQVCLNENDVELDHLQVDVPPVETIYGVILNYKGALKKLGEQVHEKPYMSPPKAPILYIKPENTKIGYHTPIPLPTNVNELEVGAALAVVIGRTATRVEAKDALDYITGYTIANDISIPHESVYRPAIKQKARDGFCPIGPWVISKDSIPNPNSLNIRVYINNECKQENTTENLIRNIQQLIADVTQFMTLHVGDTLLVGVPENPPLARAGDVVTIEIDGIGRLENKIVEETKLHKEGLR
jgi:5-oxopent-3-ene-1,2,5-tricarboxylate decarboxylase / 2-hydroxyhepta-2,4-diene-1,7-dioate isomerase